MLHSLSSSEVYVAKIQRTTNCSPITYPFTFLSSLPTWFHVTSPLPSFVSRFSASLRPSCVHTLQVTKAALYIQNLGYVVNLI